MKKKYRIILYTSIFLLCVVASIILVVKKSNSVYEEESKPKVVKHKSMLSMNLEQTAGSGDYKTVTQSSWPTEGYKFNTELSRCENGSTLSWDDSKKAVVMNGNVSDKCYVYFDKVLTLANYVISQYTGIQGENSLYYHDSNLANGVGDNSYRYAGASDSVNNYICLGSDAATCPDDNLFRIIGVFGAQTKVIRAKSVGNQKWDTSSSNKWSSSSLNTYLNGTYLTSLGTLKNKIATTTWKVGGGTPANISEVVPATAYKNEVGSSASRTIVNKKIGLMYVTDYYYSASPSAWTLVGYNSSDTTKDYRVAKTINWLYLGSIEWTISCHSGTSYSAFGVGNLGYVSGYFDVSTSSAVRPTFNLESSVKYVSGSGSMSDPVRVN